MMFEETGGAQELGKQLEAAAAQAAVDASHLNLDLDAALPSQRYAPPPTPLPSSPIYM